MLVKGELIMKLGAMSVIVGLAVPAAAQPVVYERAVLGTTGITSGGGIAANDQFYTGWRFEVTGGPVTTTRLGGHFFPGSGTVFGAIVALTGPADDPDAFDLTGPDVLGTALVTMSFSGCSCDLGAPIALTLNDGWYMVIFGSGRFGATGFGPGFVAQAAGTATPGAQLNVTYRQATHPSGQGGPFVQGSVGRVFVEGTQGGVPCYADCDGVGGLTGNDFQCFLNRYVANDSYADCDGVGGLTANDFQCFLNQYAAGCT
jgi:hypothetical protein